MILGVIILPPSPSRDPLPSWGGRRCPRVALSSWASGCLADRGTVQKVIVLPRDDMETEELMLEEIEVFKVRAGLSSTLCQVSSTLPTSPLGHQPVPWGCLPLPAPAACRGSGILTLGLRRGPGSTPLHLLHFCSHLDASTHQDNDHLLQEGESQHVAGVWADHITGLAVALPCVTAAAGWLWCLGQSQYRQAAGYSGVSLWGGDETAPHLSSLSPNSNNCMCPRP